MKENCRQAQTATTTTGEQNWFIPESGCPDIQILGVTHGILRILACPWNARMSIVTHGIHGYPKRIRRVFASPTR